MVREHLRNQPTRYQIKPWNFLVMFNQIKFIAYMKLYLANSKMKGVSQNAILSCCDQFCLSRPLVKNAATCSTWKFIELSQLADFTKYCKQGETPTIVLSVFNESWPSGDKIEPWLSLIEFLLVFKQCFFSSDPS